MMFAIYEPILIKTQFEIDMSDVFGYEVDVFIDEVCGSLVCGFWRDVDEYLEGLFSFVEGLPF